MDIMIMDKKKHNRNKTNQKADKWTKYIKAVKGLKNNVVRLGVLVLTVHVNFVSHRAVSTNHHFCFKSSFAQKKWLVPIDCKSVMKIQLKEEMHMLCAKLWVIQLLIGCIECDIQQDNLFSFWYCKLQELHLRIVLSKFPVRLELKEGKSTWKNQLSQNSLDKYRIFLTLAEKCRGGKICSWKSSVIFFLLRVYYRFIFKSHSFFCSSQTIQNTYYITFVNETMWFFVWS